MRIINVKCKNWDKFSADDYSRSLCPVPFKFKHNIDNANKNAVTLIKFINLKKKIFVGQICPIVKNLPGKIVIPRRSTKNRF